MREVTWKMFKNLVDWQNSQRIWAFFTVSSTSRPVKIDDSYINLDENSGFVCSFCGLEKGKSILDTCSFCGGGGLLNDMLKASYGDKESFEKIVAIGERLKNSNPVREVVDEQKKKRSKSSRNPGKSSKNAGKSSKKTF